MCMSAPEGINKQRCDKTSFTAVSTFELLYMTLATDKMDGHGLNNTACLPRRLVLATERPPDSSNKTERSVIKVSKWMHSDTFKRRL